MNFGKMCSSDLCRIAFFCVVAYLIWHFLLRSVVREGFVQGNLDYDKKDMRWRNSMDVDKDSKAKRINYNTGYGIPVPFPGLDADEDNVARGPYDAFKNKWTW
jgi:hypothetical protein